MTEPSTHIKSVRTFSSEPSDGPQSFPGRLKSNASKFLGHGDCLCHVRAAAVRRMMAYPCVQAVLLGNDGNDRHFRMSMPCSTYSCEVYGRTGCVCCAALAVRLSPCLMF